MTSYPSIIFLSAQLLLNHLMDFNEASHQHVHVYAVKYSCNLVF